VASADNRAKRLRAFIRQIFFGKKCARMDSRARWSEGAGQYRLDLSQQSSPGSLKLATKLDAIEGSQLLRAGMLDRRTLLAASSAAGALP
jgi:hypothetical protein